MAESSGEPSPGDAALSKRITDYFNSPEGRQNFYEGFVSKSDLAKLTEIAQRESRRYQFPSNEGSIHQGGPSSETVRKALKEATCRTHGHAWAPSNSGPSWDCVRCGLRMQLGMGRWPDDDVASVDLDEEDEVEEADPHLMCLWCGMVCDDLEALDLHEEECEP